jgi:DNA repair protein RadD
LRTYHSSNADLTQSCTQCKAALRQEGELNLTAPQFTSASTTALNLRLYQVHCVNSIRDAFWWNRRVLFVLPTGGGKTVIFAYITASAAEKGNAVIILAHRQEIADQISVALTTMGVRHGRIQPGHSPTDDLVQVGMVQTVARRLHEIAEPKLLIIDEAHHAVAGTWKKIAAAWPNAKILGVTATPERLDGLGMRDAFDELVVGPDVQDLIDQGFLAPFRYLAPGTVDISSVSTVGGDYNLAELEAAVDQSCITGNAVEHYLKHLARRTAIVFCTTIAHAENVARQFREAGIPAASIDGKMRPDQRREMVERLRSGVIRVLASCEIISEGFDVPAVGGVILLRPTKSFALFRQQVGRALRPKPDGLPAVVLDHVGNVSRHGLPNAPYDWSLDGIKRAARQRKAAAECCRTCAACTLVFGPGQGKDLCPTPGVEGCLFPGAALLDERDGELQEIYTPAWAGGLHLRDASGADRRQLLERAGADRERLQQIQEARGYKQGWVYFQGLEAAHKQGGST